MNTKKTRMLAGGLLSGGLSSRMGEPKDLIILPDGRNMLQCLIDIMLPVFGELVIAGPPIPLPPLYESKINFVKDNHPGCGPLSGIEAILSSGIARGYIIAACDQPLLTASILKKLKPDDPVIPVFFDHLNEGYIQPFPGYYPVSWLPDIRDSLRRNRRAIKSLIADCDVLLKEISSDEAKKLKSINTKEDLFKFIQESGIII